MIYSRALQVEYEHPHNEEGEGAYTVFNAIQPLRLDFLPSIEIILQQFVVLWVGTPDTRIIAMIEEALIKGVLAPVKLLHASKGNLCVVHHEKLRGKHLSQFKNAWTDIAGGVWYDDWTAEFFCEGEISPLGGGGRIFSKFAPDILASHCLRLKPFTKEMFLHYDDWTPDKIMPAETEFDLTNAPSDFPMFDDDEFDDPSAPKPS